MISLFWRGFLVGGFICGFAGLIMGMILIVILRDGVVRQIRVGSEEMRRKVHEANQIRGD